MLTEHTFGYIKEGKIFRKRFLYFEDKEVGEIRGNEESSFQYFEERFRQTETKVDDLIKMISESQNKGSFLMKLVHLKNSLSELDAIGDFEGLFKKLSHYEEYLLELIEANKLRNLEIKNGLLEEAQKFESSVDWKDSTEQLLEIKQRWIRTGSVTKEHQEPLEEQFEAVYTTFFNRKKEFYEDRQRMFDSRKEQYELLIRELEGLKIESLFQAKNAFRDLKNRWKTQENIPKSIYEALKEKFDEAFRKKQLEVKDIQKRAALKSSELESYSVESRKKLIGELEELYSNYERASFRQMKEVLERWKNEGPAPRELRAQMNQRFFELYDLIGEKKFVLKLARAKHGSFDEKPVSEQLKIKINVVKELIRRDEQELETAQENVGKFNSSSDGFNKLIEGKLEKSNAAG